MGLLRFARNDGKEGLAMMPSRVVASRVSEEAISPGQPNRSALHSLIMSSPCRTLW